MIQRRTLVKAVIAALAPLSMTSAFAAGGLCAVSADGCGDLRADDLHLRMAARSPGIPDHRHRGHPPNRGYQAETKDCKDFSIHTENIWFYCRIGAEKPKEEPGALPGHRLLFGDQCGAVPHGSQLFHVFAQRLPHDAPGDRLRCERIWRGAG